MTMLVMFVLVWLWIVLVTFGLTIFDQEKVTIGIFGG